MRKFLNSVHSQLQLAHRAFQVAFPLGEFRQQMIETLGEALEELVAGVDADGREASARGDVVQRVAALVQPLEHALAQRFPLAKVVGFEVSDTSDPVWKSTPSSGTSEI